ncbi:unnamed protein product [Parajaminaea phylloscopi]
MAASIAGGPSASTHGAASAQTRAQPDASSGQTVWTEDQWRERLLLQKTQGAETALVSREVWRSAWQQLSDGHVAKFPASLASEILAKAIDDASLLLNSPIDLAAVQTLAASLRALHALIVAASTKSSQVWLPMDQAALTECTHVLLRAGRLKSSGLPDLRSNGLSATHPPSSTQEMGSSMSSGLSGRSKQPSSANTSGAETEDVTDDASDATGAGRSQLETEGAKRKRLSAASRSVRQNAMSCLAALNDTRWSQFFSLWPTVLGTGSPIPTTASSLTSEPEKGVTNTSTRHGHGESVTSVLRSDSALSVRLAACHLIDGMLKRADQGSFFTRGMFEESNPRSGTPGPSFTPLSARLAMMIASLRDLVARLLDSAIAPPASAKTLPFRSPPALVKCIVPTQLLESLLRMTRSLVTATSTVRFRRSHTDVLRGPILSLTTHAEPAVAIAACNVLSSLSSANTAAGKWTRQPATVGSSHAPVNGKNSDATVINSIVDRLARDHLDGDSAAQAWGSLATFIGPEGTGVVRHHDDLLRMLAKHVKADAEIQRQACQTFLARYLSSSNGPAASTPTLPLYLQIAGAGATDQSALVRAETVTTLESLIPLEDIESLHENVGDSPGLRLLTKLMADSEATVRAAAVRVVGVLLMASADNTQSSRTSFDMRVLKTFALNQLPSGIHDPVLIVRLRASWSLGNLCQVIASADKHDPVAGPEQPADTIWRTLLDLAMSLSGDDERVLVNAFRSCGLLLSVARQQWLKAHEAVIAKTVTGMLAAIGEVSNPKLKWNGVNAIARAYENSDFRAWATAPSRDRERSNTLSHGVCGLLSAELACSIFKVKIAAIAGLMRVASVEEAGGRHLLEERLLPRVIHAQLKIQDEVRDATFREAQLHGQACKTGLDGLRAHLDSIASGVAR